MKIQQSDKTPHSVSFIVPALNEERVIERVVREIWSVVNAHVERYEIILINDGSSDHTGEMMDRLASALSHVRVLHNAHNVGIGTSYRRGLAESKLDYMMMLCGDGGLPAASLPAIIERIGTVDIVVPYIINLRKIKTPLRYLLSRSYTGLLNLMSGCRLHYYNGLPVHRRVLLEQITITSSGFGFQGEILVKLLNAGCSFVQVEVSGAETTNKSSVFRVRNLISVARTLTKLIWALNRYSRRRVKVCRTAADELRTSK